MAVNWKSSNDKLVVDKSRGCMFPTIGYPTHKFKNGQKVEHDVFGSGTVIYDRRQTTTVYNVEFADGSKKVFARYLR